MLPRTELEQSPLADLHVLAAEIGLDGYRRLRKADLVDALVKAGGGDVAEDGVAGGDAGATDDADDGEARPARRRGRRGGRGRARDADTGDDASDGAEGEMPEADEDADDKPAPRARRPRRTAGAAAPSTGSEEPASDEVAEGVVELLGNGSGFLRVSPPDPSDEDVYVSAAQVRRCELVSGDRVTGPVRAPRRSERYPSLVRVDTINGKPADEVAEGTHFDDLPCGFPTERFALEGDDPTLKAIEWLTPIGRGSRAVLVGAARAGKTEAVRRLARALNAADGVDQVSVVLAGVRPEEVGEWTSAGIEPAASLTLASSADAQAQAAERAVETARRVAARGGHAVVIVDTLDGMSPSAARRILAAARNIVDGGSLTVIATAQAPLGGETTVIAFDRALTGTGRFPALDLGASGALRPELLVGQAGADAIAQARATALGDA